MVELLRKTLRNLSKKVVPKLNQKLKKAKMLKQLHPNQLKKTKKRQLVQVVMTNSKYQNYKQ